MELLLRNKQKLSHLWLPFHFLLQKTGSTFATEDQILHNPLCKDCLQVWNLYFLNKNKKTPQNTIRYWQDLDEKWTIQKLYCHSDTVQKWTFGRKFALSVRNPGHFCKQNKIMQKIQGHHVNIRRQRCTLTDQN